MRESFLVAALVLALGSGQAAALQPATPTSAAAPVAVTSGVSVTLGEDLTKEARKLGEGDVRLQAEDLSRLIQAELDREGSLWTGARVNLVILDLKPNRPTLRQAIDRPGLSMLDSKSIGGARIEGEMVTADGRQLPIRYQRYSSSLMDVFGFSTWEDADRAFDGLAANLRRGRLLQR